MQTTTKRAAKDLVTICLYGTRAAGFYCLGSVLRDLRKMPEEFGKCPEQGGRMYETATEAIWAMTRDMMDAGVRGPVSIHMDDVVTEEPMVALVDHIDSVPNFGSLTWKRGDYAVTLSPEQIETMGSKPGQDDHPRDAAGFDKARMAARAAKAVR